MKLKLFSLLFGITLLLVSCAPKDADIQKAVAEKMTSMPDVTIMVSQGVVTLGGKCDSQANKDKCTEIAKSVKGVKSVVNNCEIPAPVVINPDEILSTGVNTVLANFKGVNATVSNGVITLNGELEKAKLPDLMQAIQELKPQKVENKLILK